MGEANLLPNRIIDDQIPVGIDALEDDEGSVFQFENRMARHLSEVLYRDMVKAACAQPEILRRHQHRRNIDSLFVGNVGARELILVRRDLEMPGDPHEAADRRILIYPGHLLTSPSAPQPYTCGTDRGRSR